MIQSHTKQPTASTWQAVHRQNYGTAEERQARTPGQHKNSGKREKQDMNLTITAITTDATKPIHTHLRNLPTGTVAIFAPHNTQRTPTVATRTWHHTAMSAATFTLSALLAYIATEAIWKRIRGRN